VGSESAVAAVGVLVSISAAFALRANYEINASASALGVMGVCACLELFELIRFEQLRKEGEALAEILSDDVQRAVAEGDFIHPDLRVEIRRFQNAGELPLVPSRYGPAVYAAVTITLGLGSLLYWTSLGS
jgi:hypothetical protein